MTIHPSIAIVANVATAAKAFCAAARAAGLVEGLRGKGLAASDAVAALERLERSINPLEQPWDHPARRNFFAVVWPNSARITENLCWLGNFLDQIMVAWGVQVEVSAGLPPVAKMTYRPIDKKLWRRVGTIGERMGEAAEKQAAKQSSQGT